MIRATEELNCFSAYIRLRESDKSKDKAEGRRRLSWGEFSTEPTRREEGGCGCLAGLECILGVVRALRMGSCLSSDGQSSSSSPSSPSSPALGAKRPRRGQRRKPAPRSYSKKEEQLHRIPGRMFLNGSSGVASLFSQQGRKGPNQDAMIVWEVRNPISAIFDS
ncbi:hypothetical protein B296_00021860 [Ensete ventricosum]|uniref:Uncharacterized protein n=1 Tax=Ensete ventricosum TaxID=4639 RepID=A0A427AZ26_ENSVE|nr:hypothetical protein B296_00021860 [Ensete ventricosum]